MRQCNAGHAPYEGKGCWPCYKQQRRARRAELRPKEPERRSVPGEPALLVVDDTWREDAACRYPPQGVAADDWFAQQQRLADRERLRLAKAVCVECPVRELCLAYAIETQQPWGLWGGLTAQERGTAYG